MDAGPGISTTRFRGPWGGGVPYTQMLLASVTGVALETQGMIVPLGDGIRTLLRRPWDTLSLLLITLMQISVPG